MKALGMIEVYGYIAAIEALDSGLKAASVNLLDVTLVRGGLVTVLINGDVGAVKAAMDASKTAAERVGKVLSVHVIARPAGEIDKIVNPKCLLSTEKTEENITSSTPLNEMDENITSSTPFEKMDENTTSSTSFESQSDVEVEQVDLETDAEHVESEIEVEHVESDTDIVIPNNVSTPVTENKVQEIHIDIQTLTPTKMQTMTVEKLRKLAREIRITNMTNKQIRFATKNELIKSISEFIEQEN